mgnify:CR=1 FL=1
MSEIVPLYPTPKSKRVIANMKGISTFIVDFATRSGVITEDIPKIIRMLRILLPTIFPIVISALPPHAAVILTAASGALVPIATIVRPITI